MKAITILASLWLLCGVTAAGLENETRQSTLSEVTLGPISLVRALVG